MSTATRNRIPPVGAQSSERAGALEARGLTKVFGRGDSARRVVDDVDLVVHAGEVVALLGPNGAGKTTTIKMAAGLVTPTEGQVTILGEDLRRHRGAAVRHLGAVLEGGRNVYWALSAWQNLVYFGRLRGLRTREIAPRAEWLLRQLDLWERRREAVGAFSRGMQQKVAIAAALVSDPALLLLDEPTIGLDVTAARTVKDWIRRLADEQQKAVVLTTHQLAVAQELAHRVTVIDAGRILADRPVGDLLDQFGDDRFEIDVAVPPEALPPSMLYEVRGRDRDHARLLVDNRDNVYEVLDLLAHQRVPLVAVTPARPDLEEVFVRLVRSNR
jgi:ABC-2 type transport system ATP-binding protein